MKTWRRGVRTHRTHFEFALSDVQLHLNSADSVAVAVDNVSLTWRRGRRSVAATRARVVERLDHVTGELLRTAPLVVTELALPCTLFRQGDDVGPWDAKPSELLLVDTDAEPEDATLCCVVLELTPYAASQDQPAPRSRVELELERGMGRLYLTIGSRLLSSGAPRQPNTRSTGWTHHAPHHLPAPTLKLARRPAADSAPSALGRG